MSQTETNPSEVLSRGVAVFNMVTRNGNVFLLTEGELNLLHRASGFNETEVSQSCAVAKSEKFWWVTGRSNLADGMESDCSIGQHAGV